MIRLAFRTQICSWIAERAVRPCYFYRLPHCFRIISDCVTHLQHRCKTPIIDPGRKDGATHTAAVFKIDYLD